VHGAIYGGNLMPVGAKKLSAIYKILTGFDAIIIAIVKKRLKM
jgi:hypothetical protein